MATNLNVDEWLPFWLFDTVKVGCGHRVCVYVSVSMYVCMCMHVNIDIYIYIYIYIYIP